MKEERNEGRRMNSTLMETIQRAASDSLAGTRNFGEIVGSLIAENVESYRADYRLGSTTYFMPSGESHTVALPTPTFAIGEAFDRDAIVAAIRASQRGEVKYPEFIARSMAAGCVGYVVWIAGKHVTYFGRRGETHVEHFPTKPS